MMYRTHRATGSRELFSGGFCVERVADATPTRKNVRAQFRITNDGIEGVT